MKKYFFIQALFFFLAGSSLAGAPIVEKIVPDCVPGRNREVVIWEVFLKSRQNIFADKNGNFDPVSILGDGWNLIVSPNQDCVVVERQEGERTFDSLYCDCVGLVAVGNNEGGHSFYLDVPLDYIQGKILEMNQLAAEIGCPFRFRLRGGRTVMIEEIGSYP